MKTSILFTLLLVLCTACGGGGGGSKKTKRTVPISAEQIEHLLNNQRFECASLNGTDCPSGIARLFILDLNDAAKSSVCTGFMVADNILVTNNHCVSSQKFCESTYIAIYQGNHYETTKCEQILKTIDDSDPRLDYDPNKMLDFTVMRIAGRSNGPVFNISATAAQTGDAITAWVVDHTGLASNNLYESRITELSCEVDPPSSWSKSMVLKRCPVIHGNSGSPAFNSVGEIVGVIWGATGEGIDESTDLTARRAMDEYATVTDAHHFAPFIP